ncbi:MAG: helix-hairpin-helix domain-containing protein, partial [Chloroflexi bacterium]|nr:helix-hairpin-helix domain-containing protein [Chloroflexota bacterium]
SRYLPLEHDPKTTIALENVEAFPIDVNAAGREQLLRVPGIGPVSAQRILRTRSGHSIDSWRDLQAMGVVRAWAWPFWPSLVTGHQKPSS